jgi:hypothetical protein
VSLARRAGRRPVAGAAPRERRRRGGDGSRAQSRTQRGRSSSGARSGAQHGARWLARNGDGGIHRNRVELC